MKETMKETITTAAQHNIRRGTVAFTSDAVGPIRRGLVWRSAANVLTVAYPGELRYYLLRVLGWWRRIRRRDGHDL